MIKLYQNSQLPVIFTVLLVIFCGIAGAESYWLFLDNALARHPGDAVDTVCIAGIADTGARIRVISRYFNAVSVDWDGDIATLSSLQGVDRVEPVKSLGRRKLIETVAGSAKAVISSDDIPHTLSYGLTEGQLETLNIPALHDLGFTGRGVTIGVLDTGFRFSDTACLEQVDVAHVRNFITGNHDIEGDSHGGYVLACLAGKLEGVYYGAAFGATYLLAVTDDVHTERRADEDRWVAAIEWCDSLGADIISSSLVYNEFDTVEESYSREDMDGRTSLVAQAAGIAVERGILVVNSAGNEGSNSWGIITTPGDSEKVIAVGSVDYRAEPPEISTFSSRGPTADGRIKPDVVAPGTSVMLPSLGTSDAYTVKNGTSYAAPLVSGLCALLLEAHPDWTPSHIREALTLTAVDLGDEGPDNDYGWGLPDALNALNYQPNSVAGDNATPQTIKLGQPYPNPFNAEVTIPYFAGSDAWVTVSIYDITGRHVATLSDGMVRTGSYHVTWHSDDVGTGVYIIRAVSPLGTAARKVIFLK